MELLASLGTPSKYSPSAAPNLLVTANWHLTNDPSLTHGLPTGTDCGCTLNGQHYSGSVECMQHCFLIRPKCSFVVIEMRTQTPFCIMSPLSQYLFPRYSSANFVRVLSIGHNLVSVGVLERNCGPLEGKRLA